MVVFGVSGTQGADVVMSIVEMLVEKCAEAEHSNKPSPGTHSLCSVRSTTPTSTSSAPFAADVVMLMTELLLPATNSPPCDATPSCAEF